jgi:DivIVA domain
MRITPLDIRKQEFKKVMRGLDADEVYAFLNTVAEEYEAVLSDNKNLRERLVAIEERLNEFKSIETNLRNTLLTAEKLTQEAKESARARRASSCGRRKWRRRRPPRGSAPTRRSFAARSSSSRRTRTTISPVSRRSSRATPG